MTAQRHESAPGRALWGLQLIAGAALATAVVSMCTSLVTLSAMGSSADRYGDWETARNIHDLSPWLFAFLAVVSAVGWWLAGAMPRYGRAFRAVGVLAGLQAVLHTLQQVAVRRNWIDDVGAFFAWYRWVSWPLWILLLAGIGVTLIVAGRHARGRAAVMAVALVVVLVRTIVETFSGTAQMWLYEHPWHRLAIDTADNILWVTAVVLLSSAVRRLYEPGGLGSYRIAAEGLGRYRSAITMRIVLAVSVIGMSFMAVAAQALVMLQVVLAASVVAGVIIAVLAARGLVGFARQPVATGGGHWAIAGALLSIGTLLFTAVGLLDLPDVFSRGGDFRRAAESLQAMGNYANIIGFAGVIFILLSLLRLARHLDEPNLASRARGLMVLIAVAAGAVVFLQQFGAAGMIRSTGTLIAVGILVLVLAIAALVRYLSLLSDVETKLVVDHGSEPPKATATVRDD